MVRSPRVSLKRSSDVFILSAALGGLGLGGLCVRLVLFMVLLMVVVNVVNIVSKFRAVVVTTAPSVVFVSLINNMSNYCVVVVGVFTTCFISSVLSKNAIIFQLWLVML